MTEFFTSAAGAVFFVYFLPYFDFFLVGKINT